MKNDVIARLQIDPGHRTLGQLLQDREAALQEIHRLQRELENSLPLPPARHVSASASSGPNQEATRGFRPGTLIRAGDVCELLSISRATLHRLRKLPNFPKPVNLGPNTIRWDVDVIRAWGYKSGTRSSSRT